MYVVRVYKELRSPLLNTILQLSDHQSHCANKPATMSTHRALILTSKTTPLTLQTVPTPSAVPGSIVVKVLGTYILPYLSSVLDGSAPYALSLPLTPGANTIGRVHAVGADATVVAEGQLVFCDTMVKARDDPDVGILMGLHGGLAMGLMEGEWRDGSFAEFARFPLENVFVLDEGVLCGEMGYSVEDLCAIPGSYIPLPF